VKMSEESMNIAIVGHIDHGKSTLTGRIFYDTDSLPEEKIEEIRKTCKELGREFEFAYAIDHLQEEREQEMTIDTAQTFFKTSKRRYVIIDTPGHKEFMRNMITGASQADAAILIVDAKKGMEEQTKRHAYVLAMLGVNQLILVLNKMDTVDYSQEVFNQVKDSTTRFLKNLGIEPSYVIPISAKNGDNIAKNSEKLVWYKGRTVLQGLDSFKTEESKSKKVLRFPVQDVYTINGKKIVVGRIEQGEIRKGDKVLVLPNKTKTKISSIVVYNNRIAEKNTAEAGESIGIIIEDDQSIKRGNLICTETNIPEITNHFRADVFWMSENPLNLKEKITLKLATEESEAVIEKMEKKINSSSLEEIKDDLNHLRETEVGVACIKTAKPLMIDTFSKIPELGRFVLIRNNDIAAGGIIV